MNIALIGDSHSQALFPRLRPVLEAAGHTIVHEVSNPGWGAKKFVNEGLASVPRGTQAVIVSLGGNNQNLGQSYGEDVARFLISIGTDKPIVWIGPATSEMTIAADTGQRHEWTADYLQGVLPSKGIKFIDARPFTMQHHRDDGVHFTHEGYDQWAQRIGPIILRNLSFAPPMKRVLRVSGLAVAGLVTIYGLYFLYDTFRGKD